MIPLAKRLKPERSRPSSAISDLSAPIKSAQSFLVAVDVAKHLAELLMVFATCANVRNHSIRRAFWQGRHPGMSDKDLAFCDGKALQAFSLACEKAHDFFSASSMSFQNPFAPPSCSSSSSIGRLERKRKSRIVFLCSTRWMRTPSRMLFEVDPVILGPATMELAAAALQPCRSGSYPRFPYLPEAGEIPPAGRVAALSAGRHLCRADRIEYHLKHGSTIRTAGGRESRLDCKLAEKRIDPSSAALDAP